MAFKVRSAKKPFLSTRGDGGSKKSKNLSTWYMNDPYAKFIRLKDSKCPTKTYFKVVVHYVRMEKDGTQKQQVSYLLLCTCVVPVFSCSKDVDPVYQFAKRPISCCTLSAVIDFRAQMSFLYCAVVNLT